MKILVTGSRGYIGQRVIAKLGEHELIACDIEKDIRQLEPMTVDAVIHLAALVRVGESVQRPLDYYDVNVAGTINLLKNVQCDHFIFASTGCATGMASPYAISKAVGEQIVATHPKHTILRFYNVIGGKPTNPDGLFAGLCRAVTTGEFLLHGVDHETRDGTCVRDYVHVDDIADAICAALDCKESSVEHLGNGVGYTVREVIAAFKRVNNVDFQVVEGPRRAGDQAATVLDRPSKLLVQKHTLDDMVRLG